MDAELFKIWRAIGDLQERIQKLEEMMELEENEEDDI